MKMSSILSNGYNKFDCECDGIHIIFEDSDLSEVSYTNAKGNLFVGYADFRWLHKSTNISIGNYVDLMGFKIDEDDITPTLTISGSHKFPEMKIELELQFDKSYEFQETYIELLKENRRLKELCDKNDEGDIVIKEMDDDFSTFCINLEVHGDVLESGTYYENKLEIVSENDKKIKSQIIDSNFNADNLLLGMGLTDSSNYSGLIDTLNNIQTKFGVEILRLEFPICGPYYMPERLKVLLVVSKTGICRKFISLIDEDSIDCLETFQYHRIMVIEFYDPGDLDNMMKYANNYLSYDYAKL